METAADNTQLHHDIDIIMAQTTYTKDEAVAKLNKHITVMDTIRDFHGIKPKSTKNIDLSKINQEIYRQFRQTLPIRQIDASHVLSDGAV